MKQIGKDRVGVKKRPVNGTDSSSETAFDTWLQRGLHQLFDGVAREPIPEELLRIIEDDRNKA